MKKYDSYKESGIDWYGQVPHHWRLTRLKFLGDAIGGVTYSPEDVVEEPENGVLVLRSSNIQNGKLDLKDTVYINQEISEKQTVRYGDILICSRNGSRRLIGKNICIDERTAGETFGAFMMVFRSKYYRWLSQYFNSPIFKSQSGLFLTSTINQLTSGTINNFSIAIPESEEEQTQIANYLDRRTAQLEDLISKKDKLIDLLREERTAIINQAVTKGLDPNAPMKDSGVEWLGEVPEHWEVTRLKFLGDAIGGVTYSPNDVNEDESGTLILRSSNIQNGKLSLKDNVYVSLEVKEKQTLREGDILICSRNGSRKLIGKNITIGRQMAGQSFGAFMMVFRSEKWRFLSKFFNSQVFSSQSGLFLTSTINQLTSTVLKNMYVAIPGDDNEMNEVAAFISVKCEEIDSVLEKTEREIDLLREYKTTLISEVVTGKVDVRNELIA